MPPSGYGEQTGLLQDRLMILAGTPDDSSRVATELIVVAQLAATLIAPVDYATVPAGLSHHLISTATIPAP
jgi:hypothetical protein